jgi:hypothetical protein
MNRNRSRRGINCKVYAPSDTRVTNLTISEGMYAHTGQQVFTLIDARVWWAIANFRAGTLQHIVPGERQTFFYSRSRMYVSPALWIASVLVQRRTRMFLAVWNLGFQTHSGHSTGCIWHRDIPSASASRILLPSCFEWVSRQLSKFGVVDHSNHRSNRAEFDSNVGAAMGVSQRGTRALSR